ncbi:MAG TPA: aminotransferase class I/II-fold pyridoxal phosphate-dependent enzyme [Ignavibacteriaceae bacterium]|nr:aminotransferase class I/II-fold pyridoxal phosphate-dependent enzyme [Ignavibacteriaceae bacterium]
MDNILYSGFIGPKAENIEALRIFLNKVLDHQRTWRQSFFKEDDSLYKNFKNDFSSIEKELDLFLQKYNSNTPFFHPRYSAQMLKDTTLPTIIGYLAFMLTNPNNHAYEGGPVTTDMEIEVVSRLKNMIGYKQGWGHLTSGGSLANTEALWAIRDYYKNGTVYFSEVSHYSWKRICSILRIPQYEEVNVDKNFRIDLNQLEEKLKHNPALAVIANFGSTGTGSVDDIEGLLQLKNKYDFHLHVDAAYGGFLRTIILDEKGAVIPYKETLPISDYVYKQMFLLNESDSITIDPHKQGLISYGAGAVLYKNEELRSVILNTAPYTYHQLDKPNIGMFSFEGSRPGAMAAACYLTYKVFPLNNVGVGKVAYNSLKASKEFYNMIEDSDGFKNLHHPDLDLNCFYVNSDLQSATVHNEYVINLYKQLSVEAENPEFILSKFVMTPELSRRILPNLENSSNENVIALRSVFMKHWNGLDENRYIKMLVDTLNRKLSEIKI